MKYIIILGDGMADEPIGELDNKTPLTYADTPVMDALAEKSELGIAYTVPQDMSPGSDVANLSVLGYDPKEYYSGRSPLEALSIGVEMASSDIAIRCNLVTVTEDEKLYQEQLITDHSAGEISTEEAEQLLKAVAAGLETEEYNFFCGTSYRHLLIWHRGRVEALTPPHDVLGAEVGKHLPENPVFKAMMEKSYQILKDHPINLKRKEQGKNPANSIWFWGAGTKPHLSSFEEKNGKKGAMISAVDLLKGIAVGAGMKSIDVEGADGTLHTNYEGKAQAAVDVLLKDGYDFVYVHVEAPDEMGHQGDAKKKIQAIEYLDSRVIKPVLEAFEEKNVDFRMLILPDHPTPIHLRTHTKDAVPYMLYDSTRAVPGKGKYNEADARTYGTETFESGHLLIEHLFSR